METHARLLSLATVVPKHVLEQHIVAELAQAVFAHRMRNYARIAGVFAGAGIERRYAACDLEWFAQPHGWPERTAVYIEEASALYERAAHKALALAGLRPCDVDVLVTVSSTGIATPSLEARLAHDMGFRANAQRVPVFGLGCAGGVSGLAIASHLTCARRGVTVLLVAVELCSLAFRPDRATKVNVVASALFGDGAAALVLTSDDALPAIATITSTSQHLWPKTLDIMGWSIDDVGFGVVLSRSLPLFVVKNYRAVFYEACAHMGIADAPIGRVVCHPGGAKVLEALEDVLALERGGLDHERAVMRDFGNMSSPTVFFVLERVIAQGLARRTVLAALGPGFTASFATLESA
jgi:alkylresorcinol/alkylpyrone synthase